MNASRISLLCSVILATATSAAQAIDAAGEGEPLSRAQVLADLEVWKQSGMAAFADGEASIDVHSAAYRTAQARYIALRSSPEFAQLVTRIARERGDEMQVAQ
jgi:hypothetical protein